MRYDATAVGGLLALILAAAAVPSAVKAHGGGLDSRGCHRDGSAGNYHCHRGPHAGETFPSKSAYPGGSQGGGPTSSRAYDRDEYHRRWLDRDGDCQDARQEVLIAESLEPVELGPDGCRVVSGRWYGRYTGRVFTDPGDLDIDHLVPLKEAHESGAARWPTKRKRRYANDLKHPDTLIAVEAGANRSKGSRDPAEWLPPNEAYHCEYVQNWVDVKRRWGLNMDTAERAAVEGLLLDCE